MALPAGSEVVVGGITALVRIDGYEKGIIAGQGPWRKIKYRVDWDDSDTFMDGLMGLTTYTGGVGGFVYWPIPHAYPGNSYLRCVECDAKPLGPLAPDVAKIVTSTYAEVSATYRALNFDVEGTQPDMSFNGEPKPWIRDEIRGYIQPYRIGAGGKKQAASGPDPGAVIPGSHSIRVAHYDYRRTIHGLPYLAIPQLQSLSGKINSDTFWGQPRGTFLFEPPDITTEIQTDGSRTSVTGLVLSWRPNDWNMDFDTTSGEFVLAETQASQPTYAYADFSIINTLGT